MSDDERRMQAAQYKARYDQIERQAIAWEEFSKERKEARARYGNHGDTLLKDKEEKLLATFNREREEREEHQATQTSLFEKYGKYFEKIPDEATLAELEQKALSSQSPDRNLLADFDRNAGKISVNRPEINYAVDITTDSHSLEELAKLAQKEEKDKVQERGLDGPRRDPEERKNLGDEKKSSSSVSEQAQNRDTKAAEKKRILEALMRKRQRDSEKSKEPEI